jgi:hypothetical protein
LKNERHGAVEAAAPLHAIGKHAAVVSMPCWDLFERQTEDYRRTILGSAPRIAIEAGARLGSGTAGSANAASSWHERVRRLGARSRSLSPLRHHSGRGGRGGEVAGELKRRPTSEGGANRRAVCSFDARKRPVFSTTVIVTAEATSK